MNMKLNWNQIALIIVIVFMASLGFLATNLFFQAEQELTSVQQGVENRAASQQASQISSLQKYLSQIPDSFEVTHVYGQDGAYLIAARRIESERPFVVTFRVYGSEGDRLKLDYDRTIDSGYAEPTHSLEDLGDDPGPLKIGMKDRFGYGTEWSDFYYLSHGELDEDLHYSRALSLKYVRGGSLEIDYGGSTTTLTLVTDKECVRNVGLTPQIVHVTGIQLGDRLYKFIDPLEAYCPASGGGIWIDKIDFLGGAKVGTPLYITIADNSRKTIDLELENMIVEDFGDSRIFRSE